MYFLVENDDLLKKYKNIQDKVITIYNKTFLKTKIKSHGSEVTDLYDKEIPKVDSNHTCLAVITLDFGLKKMRIIICKCF